MKSSVIEFFSWNPATKREVIPKQPTKSCFESDNIIKTGSGSPKEKMGHVNHQFQKRLKQMPPLLRLDSEGEISTGHQLCHTNSTRPINGKTLHEKLRFSNSFDSSCGHKTSALNASRSMDANPGVTNHIPCHLSFKKSMSLPSHLPEHQSFPPASPLSATRNGCVCALTEQFTPYSPNHRSFGSAEIFGSRSFNPDRDSKQYNCAISPSYLSTSIVNNSKKENMQFEIGCNPPYLMNDQESYCSKGVKSMSKCELKSSPRGKVLCNKDQVNFAETSKGCECGTSGKSVNSNVNKKKKKRSRNRHKRCPKETSPSIPLPCSSSPMKALTKLLQSAPLSTGSSSIDVSDKKKRLTENNNCAEVDPASSVHETSMNDSKIISSSPGSHSSIIFCSESEYSTEHHMSDDDDSIFGDGGIIFMEENTKHKTSPKQQKQKRKHDLHNKYTNNYIKACVSSDSSDNESDIEEKGSPPSSSLCFTFVSLGVSEDEDNDSSVDWDLSTSPAASDPFIFEFDFNTGLSLEAIIGQNQPSPSNCSTTKKLKEVNQKWNKYYTSSSPDSISSQPKNNQKVHFAQDEDLVTEHVVGNEDRGGDWHHVASERERFYERIADIGKIIAPVLCSDHRAKVLKRLSV